MKNTAQGHGSFGTTPVPSNFDDETVTAVQRPHLTLTKVGVLDMAVVAPSDRADPGDKINYTLTTTNDGNVTLTGVTVVDTKASPLTCTIDGVPATSPFTLAPGKAVVCTGSYTLVLADINAGTVHNVARADSDQTPPTDTPNDVPLPSAPHLTLTKVGVLDMAVVAPSDRADPGDKINYTLTATNDGNVTLTGVTVVDTKASPLTCTIDGVPATSPFTLLSGKAVVCTGSYTLVLADINAGTVHNVARADSDQTPPTDTPNDVPVPPAPHLTLTKVGVLNMAVVAPSDRADPGDKINYTLTATNDGNVTLTGVTVVDTKASPLTCTIDGVPATSPFTLAPGKAVVCTGSYTLVLADINAGTVHNVATGGQRPDPADRHAQRRAGAAGAASDVD